MSVYDLRCLEQDEKWETLERGGSLLVIVHWVGSPLTSSEPVGPTGPTFSSRASTWGGEKGKDWTGGTSPLKNKGKADERNVG